MSMMMEKRSKLTAAIDFLFYQMGLRKLSPVRTALAKAYDAPFPDNSYKMGTRAMPSQVPTMKTSPSLEAQAKAWAFFSQYQKPFLCAFADDDPVTKGGDAVFLAKVPGTKGQPHTTIKGGGHFVQEGNPSELCQVIGDFVRAS
jgi:haloalkane dehalogenase